MNSLQSIGINSISTKNFEDISIVKSNLAIGNKFNQNSKSNNPYLQTTNDISCFDQSRTKDLSYQNYDEIPIRSYKEESFRYGDELIPSRDDSIIIQHDGNCHQSAQKVRENFYELSKAQQKSDSIENENISTPKVEGQSGKSYQMNECNINRTEYKQKSSIDNQTILKANQLQEGTKLSNLQNLSSEVSPEKLRSKASALEQISQFRCQSHLQNSEESGLQKIWKKRGLYVQEHNSEQKQSASLSDAIKSRFQDYK